MKNVMEFEGGYKAIIAYDPEIEMFRGDFTGLNGGADFYAVDLPSLHREGEESLRVFLEECARCGVTPRKSPTGNFALRLDPETYQQASLAAAAQGRSLNAFITDAVRRAVSE